MQLLDLGPLSMNSQCHLLMGSCLIGLVQFHSTLHKQRSWAQTFMCVHGHWLCTRDPHSLQERSMSLIAICSYFFNIPFNGQSSSADPERTVESLFALCFFFSPISCFKVTFPLVSHSAVSSKRTLGALSSNIEFSAFQGFERKKGKFTCSFEMHTIAVGNCYPC